MSTGQAGAPNALHTGADSMERLNNVAQYTSPVFSGFTLNLAVVQNKNNSDAVAALGKNSTNQTSISLNYAQGPLSVGVGMNDQKVSTEVAAVVNAVAGNAGTAAVVEASRKNDLDWIGASYDLGVATVYGTHVKRKGTGTDAAGVTTTLNSVKVNAFGVMVPMGAVTLRASMYSGKDTRGEGTADDMKLSGHQLSASYALSKRTSLVAAAGTNQYKRDAASTAATRKQTATTMTVNHTF
jgi:predicted porin